jgi:hypothetical protein
MYDGRLRRVSGELGSRTSALMRQWSKISEARLRSSPFPSFHSSWATRLPTATSRFFARQPRTVAIPSLTAEQTVLSRK